MTNDERQLADRLAEAARAVCDAHDLGTVPLNKMVALADAVRAWDDGTVRALLSAPEPDRPAPPPLPAKTPRARRKKAPLPPPTRRLLEAPPDDDIEGEPTRQIRLTPHPMRAVDDEKK